MTPARPARLLGGVDPGRAKPRALAAQARIVDEVPPLRAPAAGGTIDEPSASEWEFAALLNAPPPRALAAHDSRLTHRVPAEGENDAKYFECVA
jgi:hypothetical protein